MGPRAPGAGFDASGSSSANDTAGSGDVVLLGLPGLAKLARLPLVRVNMHEAKTNLSRLVAAVESGEEEEVEIARAGKVVARIVPVRPRAPRRPGRWAGRVRIHRDFDDLPAEVAAAFRGDRA